MSKRGKNDIDDDEEDFVSVAAGIKWGINSIITAASSWSNVS